MESVIHTLTTVTGLLSLTSLAAMIVYLINNKVLTITEAAIFNIWPRSVFQYRDHTKNNKGRVGFWYWVFMPNILAFAIMVSVKIYSLLHEAPWPILVVGAMVYFIIAAAIVATFVMFSKDSG